MEAAKDLYGPEKQEKNVERRMKKQASQQRLEHNTSFNLEKVLAARPKSRSRAPPMSSRSAGRDHHTGQDFGSRPAPRSASSHGLRPDSRLCSVRSSGDARKSSEQEPGAGTRATPLTQSTGARSINIQIKNKQFKQPSPKPRVLPGPDWKSKDTALLRAAASTAAPPKSPSALSRHQLLASKCKLLNASLISNQKARGIGATAQVIRDAQLLTGRQKRKKTGSEQRHANHTASNIQRKDAGPGQRTQAVLETSSLKSSAKLWNLPHNKFNYPHVPVAQK